MSDVFQALGGRIMGIRRDRIFGYPATLVVEKDGKRFDVYAYDEDGHAMLYAEEVEIVSAP